jgi:Na+-transporting NADH:ubiquinone oxidoreductase subunit A
MSLIRFDPGLTVHVPSPPGGEDAPVCALTEEAGIRPSPGDAPRIVPLVEEGATVAQGAPVARLRDAPGVSLVAPMPARVARISLLPGHRLSEIVLFRHHDGDVATLDRAAATSEAGLRDLAQASGFWPWLRRRPFGGVPAPDERPAAIFVMAADSRPLSPDPVRALSGQEEALARGLAALARLTDGPVYLCVDRRNAWHDMQTERVRVVRCGARHPNGLAGFQIHALAPAAIDAPVWDVHAEDAAALGTLIESGRLPMTRLVRLGGEALREGRLVRTQVGADLRGLTHRLLRPGSHVLLSGSALDGHRAHWLAPRHRQVTALPRHEPGPPPHWLIAALSRADRPRPVIPSAALDHAFGKALPAAPFVRALAAGDDETAIRLGALSLLEEDVALADYVLGGEARLADLLREMLARVETEQGS